MSYSLSHKISPGCRFAHPGLILYYMYIKILYSVLDNNTDNSLDNNIMITKRQDSPEVPSALAT